MCMHSETTDFTRNANSVSPLEFKNLRRIFIKRKSFWCSENFDGRNSLSFKEMKYCVWCCKWSLCCGIFGELANSRLWCTDDDAAAIMLFSSWMVVLGGTGMTKLGEDMVVRYCRNKMIISKANYESWAASTHKLGCVSTTTSMLQTKRVPWHSHLGERRHKSQAHYSCINWRRPATYDYLYLYRTTNSLWCCSHINPSTWDKSSISRTYVCRCRVKVRQVSWITHDNNMILLGIV